MASKKLGKKKYTGAAAPGLNRALGLETLRKVQRGREKKRIIGTEGGKQLGADLGECSL